MSENDNKLCSVTPMHASSVQCMHYDVGMTMTTISMTDSMVCICGQLKRCGDGCAEASILCRYNMRKGDLFVLSWARVRRVCQGKFSSVLLTCGWCVRNILLLSLAARC